MGAYLELIRNQGQQQETDLRTNMMAAAEADPDALARAKKSADMLGLPLQAVQERLPEVEKQAFVEGVGYQDLIRNAPKTAAWLQEEQLNAGVAKDDIENLSLLESVLARVEAGGRSLAAGPLRLNASLWGVPRAGADIVSTLLTGPLANVGVLPEDVGAKASAFFQQKQAGAEAATNIVRGDLSQFGPRERALYGGIESAGQAITALPAAIATGNPNVLLGTLTASTGGEAYSTARNRGIPTAQALNFAASQAAVEYATERLPVGTLFRDLGLKRSFSRVLANQLITEMPQEQVATVLQDLNEWAVLNPEKPFAEYIAARPEAAIQTAIATAVGTGLQTAAATAVDTAVNGPRHKQAEQVFTAIADTAKNSTLRQRLPEKFKELAERYAGAQNAFIDAAMFNRYFQGVGLDPAAVATELGVRNYSEAVSAGTDLVIPMGNFAAQLAPTDHLQGLMPDLKLSQGELSAREYDAQQAEMDTQQGEIVAQAEPVAESPARQQIFDDILGQLVGRFERSTAESYATQYTAGIATMAERMGMDPLELHERYGLQIVSPLPEVLTRRPDLDTVIDPMIDAIRAGNVPTDEQVNGPSLIEFLREKGGVRDEGGELASRDANMQTPTGKRNLVQPEGLSLDAAREAAAEAGYINADSTVSDFIDLIDNELRGKPAYSMRNLDSALAEQQASLRELSNWIDQQGIDLNTVDNAAVKRMMNPEAEGREFEQGALTAQSVQQFADDVKGRHGIDELDLRLLPNGSIRLDTIAVSKTGTGAGTLAMQEIIEFADVNGRRIVLSLAEKGYQPIEGGPKTSSPARLRDFYKRFGFVENKGRNKDFTLSDGMYREPQKAGRQQRDKTLTPIYHGTTPEGAAAIEQGGFDLSKSADGTVWFTSNPEIGEVAATGSGGVVTRYIDESKMKLGGWEEADKYSTDELIGMGYDGLKLDDDGETTYQIFNPAKLSNNPNILEQRQQDGARGYIRIGDNQRMSIALLERANLSTFLHETGHMWLEVLGDLATSAESVSDSLKNIGGDVASEKFSNAFGRGENFTISFDDATVQLSLRDDADTIYLTNIHAKEPGDISQPKRGTGRGRQVVNALKAYADRTGKTFAVVDATAGGANFWDGIEWLQRENVSFDLVGDGAESYTPELSYIYRPANSASKKQIQQDYKTLLDWFGVASREQIQVEHHEQFARANEAYLMEGKAPSAALRAVFQRFKAWLTMIYRSISRLDVQLNDDVRAVFDRIYASDEEIAAARAEANLQPLFSSAEQMGMTEAEFAAYRSAVTDASVVAQDRLRAEMMDEYQREQTKWWNEERAKVRDQVATEVATLPAYVAFDALVSGTQGKLSKADLIRRYGEAYLKRIPRGYGEGKGAVYATDGGGMDIDIAAEIFGFESGDALVQALVNMRPRNALIDAETDARMREEYGDMRLDGTIAERAELALHNDLRADVLMTELRALRRKQREVAPFVQAERARQRGERAVARTAAEGVPPVEYFRNAARGMVSQQPVNELQPHRYLLAERKASRKAFEAMAKGDPNVAAAEKQRELLNHFLYLESTAAQERADKIAAYAEGLSKRSAQERIGKAGEEYLDALNEILAAYEFRSVPNRQLQLIARVRAAALAADAEGEIIDVLTDEQGNIIDQVLLSVRNYRELTIDELEAVRDMLKNIEHVAREKNKFRTAEVQAEFDEIAGRALEEIADGKPAKPVEIYKLRDPRSTKWRALPLAVTEWRGLFSYIQEAVGFKQNSTLWNYVMRPLNEAAAREAVMKREAAEKLDELFARYKTEYLYGKGKVIPGVGSLNKQQQLMVAASWGTETGRQRMLDNGFDGRGLSQEQVGSILDSLDERDWGFVRDLWELFDSYWKPLADKQQRVTGVRPKQVDPVPFMTRFGEMPGGYSPIAYENFLDNRAAQQQAAQIADEMKRAAYTRNTTRRGFLKERVQRIQGKPVRYDFGVIYKHLNEVIHDITHHETLRDVQKLLNHKVNERSVLDEITLRMGYAVRDQIVETLEEIAVGDLRVMGNSERIMEHLAAGASIAGMAYNVWNAVQNITGIANSIAVVGPGPILRGAWEWIGTPRHMLESIESVQEKSEFMRTRYINMNRDINAMRGRLEQQTGRPLVDDAYAAFRDGGFWMMVRMQQLVDMPTWIGAYDQAKRDNPDISEANAVALADQAVLAAQGGGRTVDLSKFMRGKGWARVWTVFAGYFNVTYQRTVESMRSAGVEGYTPQAIGRMVTDMFFLMMAPAMLTVIMKQAVDALVGGDEDDPDEWATKYFKEQVSYILAMFPFLRETTAAVAGYASYSGPVGARFFADLNAFIRQAGQGELDENLIKSAARVVATPFGIPISQTIKTWDGFEAMMAGEATPLALLFGPPKKD